MYTLWHSGSFVNGYEKGGYSSAHVKSGRGLDILRQQVYIGMEPNVR